jgi:aspartyl-tRNA(Asn)/glutamyl-tRNA(Gln) amidotransferase subunit A
MSTSPVGQGARRWRAGIVDGEWCAREGVEATLERINSRDGELHAFRHLDRSRVRERADELDAALAGGDFPGPLFGVPVALKANMCLEGAVCDCGSRMLEHYRPPYTATFVQRLVDAGAIPFGTTQMDEFGMGSSGENSAFEVARNPWDLSRTPGGSSSGSAVAVAAGLVPIALGSDTGGSVRQPAALCGIHGFKPTYGRISRYGLVAFGSSLDTVSPFARSTRDLELLMEVISGHDPLDSTSLALPPMEAEHPSEVSRLTGLRFGVPAEYFGEEIEPGVREACEAALGALENLGVELVPVELPHTRYAIPTYYVVAMAEASSNLARFDGVIYGERVNGDGTLGGMFSATREAGFGDEVKRRITLGTYVLSAGYYDEWYARAQKVRTLLRRDFEEAFAKVDIIATPTVPSPAFSLGQRVDDPLSMYGFDLCTVPASLAGLPAISLPCGVVPGGAGGELPIGLQLVGPALSDARLLRVAAAYEGATPHHLRRPPEGREEFSGE